MSGKIISFPTQEDKLDIASIMEEDEFDFEASEWVKPYMFIFEQYLMEQNLSPKTIDKHLSNVQFYIEEYLNYYEECEDIRKGCYAIGSYLGYFYIHKCMWASQSNMKDTATGIKKFYKCLLEKNLVSVKDYDNLCNEIKSGLPDWKEALRKYDDWDEDDEDDWFEDF